MSRCFPYPPPGYEPSPRSEHKELPKKERHKSKEHRREKGERKEKERRKGDKKGKDRDRKKLKREKRRERRRSKDRDKDNHQSPEQRTKKIGDFDNRWPEGRRKHEPVKDELIAQFPDQGGHQNYKVNCASALIPGPGSSKGFGATASKEKEKSFSRSVKKSEDATQHYCGIIQKNDGNAYANKKGADAGVGSQTRIKNGRNFQVGSGEKHSNRRRSSKVKQMKGSGDVNDQNKIDDLMHLACLDEQKFPCEDIKKRKELDANCTLHENGMKTTKLPRTSPTNITYADGKASLDSHGTAPYSSTELSGTNTQEVDWHKPQDYYSNGITGPRHLEQQKGSVSSSVSDRNDGYLKPPHPYTKYLSQLLYIPPSEDTSEYIDQGWLFSEHRAEQKTTTFEAGGSHQVWSDVQLMHTADVVALPYVVPL